MAETVGRRLFDRRSPSGRERRHPTWSGCRNREHAGDRRGRGQEHDVDRHCDPRGAARPHSCPFLGTSRRPRRSTPRCSTSSRSTPTTGSRRSSLFDLDDIDAAFEELDARYLAGEAAAHAHTWSVIAQGYAALNRRELPATTPDWVNIDHRRRDNVRARRPDRIHPCHVGRRAGPHASTSRLCIG